MSDLEAVQATRTDPDHRIDPETSVLDEELLGLDLFQSIDVAAISPLLRTCPILTLGPGEILITAGRPNMNLYIVLSGRLSIRLDSPEAVPITEVGKGESVGELSMIDHQPTSAFVVSETDSRVLVLDEELVWVLANTSHGISTNLLFTLTKRMRFGNKLIFENHERLEQYRFYATVDGLTGLFNRHWLNSMLPRQTERSRICREPFSMLMADIDEFKNYNDRHGHVAGDRALGAVADTFRNTLRPADMSVRYGGEEFLVLLPNCPLEPAEAVAERLRSAVSKTTINLVSSNRELPTVTISVGVAKMPEHGTVEDFVAEADAALFRAKEAGRNCVST